MSSAYLPLIFPGMSEGLLGAVSIAFSAVLEALLVYRIRAKHRPRKAIDTLP